MAGLLDFAKMVQQLQGGGLLGLVASPYDKKGISPLNTLEGAAPYRGGAGQGQLDLQGGNGQWSNMPQLYHGSNRAFDNFRPSHGRVYLTDNPKVASEYASYRATRSDPGAPNVTPVSARFEKPLIIDMKGKSALYADEMAGGSVNALAKKGGHDGIIYKNMMDIYSGTPQTQYIAIKPGTLKSSITGGKMFSGAGLAAILSGALGRKEPLPPM
jgi:hypothetical protein